MSPFLASLYLGKSLIVSLRGRIRFEHTEVFLLTNFDLNTKYGFVGDSNKAMLAIRTQNIIKMSIQLIC